MVLVVIANNCRVVPGESSEYVGDGYNDSFYEIVGSDVY